MPLRRQWNPDIRQLNPAFHQFPSVAKRNRAFVNVAIRRQPQEREKARPRQTHSVRTTQHVVQPRLRHFLFRARCGCIKKKVRIDEDQRKSSPSAIASASATFSRLGIRHLPVSNVRVRNLGRGSDGFAIATSPPRKAVLTTSFKVAFRCLCTCSSRETTSSSSVSVVLLHHIITELSLDA